MKTRSIVLTGDAVALQAAVLSAADPSGAADDPRSTLLVFPDGALLEAYKRASLGNGGCLNRVYLTLSGLRHRWWRSVYPNSGILSRADEHLWAAAHQTELRARCTRKQPLRALDAWLEIQREAWQLKGWTQEGDTRVWADLLEETGRWPREAVDAQLFDRPVASAATQSFGRVLCVGFHARHWKAFRLLAALAQVVDHVDFFAVQQPDLPEQALWLDLWSRFLGVEPSTVVEATDAGAKRSASVATYVCDSPAAEARVLFGGVLQALKTQAEQRAAGDALPPQITVALDKHTPQWHCLKRLLERYQWPYSDGESRCEPVPSEAYVLQHWLNYQEDPCLERAAALLQVTVDPQVASLKSLLKDLEQAREATLTDHADVNLAWLSKQLPKRRLDVLKQRLRILPERADLQQYCSLSEGLLRNFGLAQGVLALTQTPLWPMLKTSPQPVIAADWLLWLRRSLEAAAQLWTHSRQQLGARIRIVEIDTLETLSTECLVVSLSAATQATPLMGAQDAAPVDAAQPLEVVLDALRQACEQPARVGRDRLHIYDPKAFQQLSCTRQGSSALSGGNLPESFVRVVERCNGSSFTPHEQEQAVARARVLDQAVQGAASMASDPVATQDSTRAYRARRDRQQPWGRFDAALPTTGTTLALRASSCERLLESPLSVWLEACLKVSPLPRFTDAPPMAKATGIWAHVWCVFEPAGTPHRMPELAAFRALIRQKAQASRSAVDAAFAQCGRDQPLHRDAALAAALRQALHFAACLCQWGAGTQMLQEYTLPEACELHISGTPLSLRGRIDALLLRPECQEMTVLDLKTGKLDVPLKATTLAEQGKGLQVWLYARAALQQSSLWGFEPKHCQCAVVLADQEPKPVTLEALPEPLPVTAQLAERIRSGALGLIDKTHATGPYAILSYPLATTAIPREVVNDRKRISSHATPVNDV